MRKFKSRAIWIATLFAVTALAEPPDASADYVYTGFGIDGANYGVFASGVNSQGEIVGSYRYSDGPDEAVGTSGFIYQANGSISTFDNPLAPGATSAAGVNNAGVIVGSYSLGSTSYGYIYNPSMPSANAWTSLSDPLATDGTVATGINNLGEVVGHYQNNLGTFGFIYNPNALPTAAWTTLNFPLTSGNTEAFGINDSGEVVGQYNNGTTGYGFIYNPSSQNVWTILNDPNGPGTSARGINNLGDVVGVYTGAGYGDEGFVYNPSLGTWTNINDPGYEGTEASGINDEGTVVGTLVLEVLQYDVYTAFYATPASVVPEPASIVMLSTAVALVFGFLRTVRCQKTA